MLRDADFTLQENKKIRGGFPFLHQHLAGLQPPFFNILHANAILILEVRKERNPAELDFKGLTVRQLSGSAQNRFTY